MKNTNQSFRARRKALGLNQTALASLCGVHLTTVSGWENSTPPAMAFLALEALEARAMRARFAEAMGEITRPAQSPRVALAHKLAKELDEMGEPFPLVDQCLAAGQPVEMLINSMQAAITDCRME
jgi:transcriptional regulator with XRE-family HTH domain